MSKLKSKKKQKLRDAINQYCKIYADYIFINEKIEGKLHQISISKLSEEKRAEFISICINKKVFPIRVKTPEELEKLYNAESKNIDIVLDNIYSVLNKLADKKFKKWKLKSFESGLDQLYFKLFFLNGKELKLEFKIKGSE